MKQCLIGLIILCSAIEMVMASIAGVTYMDHFDFEQRYRDVNVCNPFYWLPLHLPEECAEIFKRLMQSKLTTITPTQAVERLGPTYSYNYKYNPVSLTDFNPRTEYSQPYEPQYLSPFEKMFELLRSDVRDFPSAPTLGVSPHLGVIAIYKQPVSYKSVAMIKKLGQAYANSDLLGSIETKIGTDNNNQHQENKVKTIMNLVNDTLINDKDIKKMTP